MSTLHFILDVTFHEGGVTADLWESDEPFGSPIASADADTADQAVTNLFSQITITFPEEAVPA